MPPVERACQNPPIGMRGDGRPSALLPVGNTVTESLSCATDSQGSRASEAGVAGVTARSFRRTGATVLDPAGRADLAAEMLGHTSSKIIEKHHTQPDEAVNPVTAERLEALAPHWSDGEF